MKRLRGVTTRQILDLAEKNLITPSRETTGAGSPRLYDFQNIFEICICLAVRGRIPAGTATQKLIANILQFIREETATAQKEKEDVPGRANIKAAMVAAGFPPSPRSLVPPPFHILFIAYDDRDNYTFMPVNFNEKLGDLLARSTKYRPQNYCTYNLEVAALWEYLKNIF